MRKDYKRGEGKSKKVTKGVRGVAKRSLKSERDDKKSKREGRRVTDGARMTQRESQRR